MTEIYDVTDADTDVVQSPNERSVNKELEFDNDWSAELLADNGESIIKNLISLSLPQPSVGIKLESLTEVQNERTLYVSNTNHLAFKLCTSY